MASPSIFSSHRYNPVPLSLVTRSAQVLAGDDVVQAEQPLQVLDRGEQHGNAAVQLPDTTTHGRASWTRMAMCTRLVTSSLVRSRETCALTVASLMNRDAATSALEAPDATA